MEARDGIENWVSDKRSQRQCSDRVGDTCGKALGLFLWSI